MLKVAQAKDWCMRPNCTTCGCQKLRSAVFESTQQNLGIEKPFVLRRGRIGRYLEKRKLMEPEQKTTLGSLTIKKYRA
jgi:hypothetical protein|tara:strand:- start:3572 stop:3805 length:234 start_codon:yes stop_codon:yes gene_type:complete